MSPLVTVYATCTCILIDKLYILMLIATLKKLFRLKFKAIIVRHFTYDIFMTLYKNAWMHNKTKF